MDTEFGIINRKERNYMNSFTDNFMLFYLILGIILLAMTILAHAVIRPSNTRKK